MVVLLVAILLRPILPFLLPASVCLILLCLAVVVKRSSGVVGKNIEVEFDGFPDDCFAFLRGLKKNNNRDWFLDHREDYERCIKFPAAAFVPVMAGGLRKIFGCEFDVKIFRINRDVRFSKDKSPYSTHLHMVFYPSGRGNDGSAPACFFGIETDRVVVGVGCFEFSKAALERYRIAVTKSDLAVELDRILRLAEKSDGFFACEPHLKRVPAGFDPHAPKADLLRYKGLYVMYEHPPFAGLSSGDVVHFFEDKFKHLKPLYVWLDKVLSNA